MLDTPRIERTFTTQACDTGKCGTCRECYLRTQRRREKVVDLIFGVSARELGLPLSASPVLSSETPVAVYSPPIPRSDAELKRFLLDSFSIRLPDTQVCENHTTPFRAFADAYFARYGVMVWVASRGLGGKSYLLALLGHCEALTLAADVTILGGSGEQAARVLEYLQKWSTEEDNVKRRTLYGGGGRVTALMASSKSARGPHPQRLRCIAAGARVATPEGWRDIATIVAGDKVYSWDEGHATISTVQAAWCNGHQQTINVDGVARAFRCTPDHPILSAHGRWVQAAEASDVQAVSFVRKTDSSGEKKRHPFRASATVHEMLSGLCERGSQADMSRLWRAQDPAIPTLSKVRVQTQIGESVNLFGLRHSIKTQVHSMPKMSFEMDERRRRSEIRGSASDVKGRNTTQHSGGTSPGIVSSSRIANATAGADWKMGCGLCESQTEIDNRGTRLVLARSPDCQGERREKAGIPQVARMDSNRIADGKDALVVESAFAFHVTINKELIELPVYDLTTAHGTFIVEGIVVHNCDEVDEMDLAILDAAMGQPMANPDVAKQTVMSSTHHYADGTLTEVLKRAAEKGWPVRNWCYKESAAPPDGWLTSTEIQSKRGEVTSAMWDVEYELQEPSPEGRAILPEAVTACFKKELGEYEGALGREVVIEEPVDGATYAHGADWAKEKDFTVIDTLRTDIRPMKRVAWLRLGRMSWPMMIGKFDTRVEKYGGKACHDATGLGNVVADYQIVNAEGVVLTGQTRADVFTKYIAALENGTIESPAIRYCEGEHRYCTNNDLSGSGHPPDSFVAGAMAYRASQSKPGKVVSW